jgi:hypothetical protein
MHWVIEAPASKAARSGAKFKDFCSRRTRALANQHIDHDPRGVIYSPRRFFQCELVNQFTRLDRSLNYFTERGRMADEGNVLNSRSAWFFASKLDRAGLYRRNSGQKGESGEFSTSPKVGYLRDFCGFVRGGDWTFSIRLDLG